MFESHWAHGRREPITSSTQVALLAQLQRVDQSLKSNTEAVAARRSALEQLDAQIAAQQAQVTSAEAALAALERRQRDLDAQLTDAENKMKDRRMRIARIRNDKELGLVRREIDTLKELTGTVETELLTPAGLRSLTPQHSSYVPCYSGAPAIRDAAYHQGTVWPWLFGPFVEAWVRAHGDCAGTRARARK